MRCTKTPLLFEIHLIMNYKQAEIVVTVKTESRLALRGKYEAIEKVDEQTGRKLIEVWKNPLNGQIERIPVVNLKTTQLPKYHNCEFKTILSPAFCEYAISNDARPKKTISVPYWNKLSPKNRLKFGVKKYVEDMFGLGVEYSFEILAD